MEICYTYKMFKPELNFEFKANPAEKETGLTIYLEEVYAGKEKTEQERKVFEYLTLFKEALMNQENYIDHGGAAKVYSLDKNDICVKVMKDRHVSENAQMYDLGARPIEEFRFMEMLHNFSHGGVRAPIAEAYLESGESTAIVMEKLNAVNLQHILNGTEELPEGFDADKFLEDLDNYINALHTEKNLAHMDLYPRNIMLDRNNAQCYVIDFGRAQDVSKLPEHEQQKRFDNDYARYDEVFNQLDKFIAGGTLKKEIIPTNHEVHHFSKHTKIHLSRELKKDAIKIAKQMLLENEMTTVLPLGVSKDLYISQNEKLMVGPHRLLVNGIHFYIGVKKER